MTRARTSMLIMIGILSALSSTAGTSGAVGQCQFQHPQTAKKTTISLVQAFVPCNECACVNTGGGFDGASCTADADCQGFSPSGSCLCVPPNQTTQGGIPSCQEPQTFNDNAGSPAPATNGWRWKPTGSNGTVTFAAMSNRLISALNAIPNSADVSVRVDLNGIEDALGPVDGSGALAVTSRFTAEGRVTGDQTVITAPVSFAVPVINGRARVKTSYNAFLNGIPQPGLPGCTSLQLVNVELHDQNGTLFATPGIYLPNIDPNL